MADSSLLELQKQHRTGQEKYTYFVLAAAASAIAFAVQKTDSLEVSWSMLPLGLAVLAWGMSFYFGCKNLNWVQAATFANYNLLCLKQGVHPQQPGHPQALQAALEGVTSALEANAERASFYGAWQFRLLIVGAALFLCWHTTRLVVRTLAM
jgi:hypothetical protein